MPSPNFVSGKCFSFGDLKFYAQNGCICMHDEEDGSFSVLTCEEFKTRAAAVNDQVKVLVRLATDTPSQKSLAEERDRLQRAVADMIECYWEAKEQGDHFDPAVMAWFCRHRPWARGRVSMNRSADFATPKPSATLPVGRFTGRTTDVPSRSVTVPHERRRQLILPT